MDSNSEFINVETNTTQNVEENVTKLCRTCLSEGNDLNMKDILDIVDVLKDIVPIELEKREGWPWKICSDCLTQANQAYQFRSMCIQSDLILMQRMCFKQEKAEEEDVAVVDVNTNSCDNFKTEFESIICKEEIIEEEEEEEMCVENVETEEQPKNANDLNEHEQINLQELKCHVCEKQLETVLKYRAHIGMHKRKGTYLCKTCGKSFTYLHSLKGHERIHAGIKPYKCTECDKSFVQSSSLMLHLSTHTKEKNHVCHVCDKKFTRRKNLRRHTLNKHEMSIDQRPHVCECGKTFREKRYLTQHRNSVHGTERKYVCKWCDKAYSLSNSLYQHEKLHKGDDPFVCTVCGRTFIYKNSLRAHINTHTKPK